MFTVRGKWLIMHRHGQAGADSERPPVTVADIIEVIEDPGGEQGESDDRTRAWKWCGSRTVILTYAEDQEEIHVIAVSATTRRL